ncbi:MAG: hypothetical protein JWO38_297 [Gemmataceae bacterium]|nr:hypothetical protein [Gemmataceae bacterium]
MQLDGRRQVTIHEGGQPRRFAADEADNRPTTSPPPWTVTTVQSRAGPAAAANSTASDCSTA